MGGDAAGGVHFHHFRFDDFYGVEDVNYAVVAGGDVGVAAVVVDGDAVGSGEVAHCGDDGGVTAGDAEVVVEADLPAHRPCFPGRRECESWPSR